MDFNDDVEKLEQEAKKDNLEQKVEGEVKQRFDDRQPDQAQPDQRSTTS